MLFSDEPTPSEGTIRFNVRYQFVRSQKQGIRVRSPSPIDYKHVSVLLIFKKFLRCLIKFNVRFESRRVICPRSLLLGFVKTCVIQKRTLVNHYCSLLDNALSLFVLYKHRGYQMILIEIKVKMPKLKILSKIFRSKLVSIYLYFQHFSSKFNEFYFCK